MVVDQSEGIQSEEDRNIPHEESKDSIQDHSGNDKYIIW